MSNTASTQYIEIRYNYARLSYQHSTFHIVGWPGALKPHARALCGVVRIAEQPSDRPSWQDCRMLPPSNICDDCDTAAIRAASDKALSTAHLWNR
jgi:hypothetical protein